MNKNLNKNKLNTFFKWVQYRVGFNSTPTHQKEVFHFVEPGQNLVISTQ